jgi:hypothetical protein
MTRVDQTAEAVESESAVAAGASSEKMRKPGAIESTRAVDESGLNWTPVDGTVNTTDLPRVPTDSWCTWPQLMART